jgi:23S rRNA (adenine-N6)-dimethyltransferase
MTNLKHSQNFLHSSNLVSQLLKKSSIRPEDVVYEIGPGKAIITLELAKQAKLVVAIEADDRLYSEAKARLQEVSNVDLHHADFLQYSLPKNEYKIFSNIPFNITADITKKLTDAPVPPVDSYLIVQKEAAVKFAGTPYGKETLFSLTHKPWFNFSIVHHFKQNDFYPVPKVNIVLLRIEKLKKPLINPDHAAMYKDFLAYGFTSFKPTLKKGLSKIFSHVQFLRLADELKFTVSAKPTDLTSEQWLGMFNYFLIGVEPWRQKQVIGSLGNLNKQQAKLEKVHRTRTAKNWKRLHRNKHDF